MKQADWVKESSDILLSVIEDHTGDSESNLPDAESKLHKLISKVESLAQQRTEKKWRAKAKAGYMTYSETGGVPYNMVSANNQALTKLLEE